MRKEVTFMNEDIVKSIRYYTVRTVRNYKELPEAVFDFYDLTFVLAGTLSYIVDDESYFLKKNDAIIIKPGQKKFRHKITEPVKYVSINFTIFDDSCIPKQTFMNNIITENIYKLISLFPVEYRATSIRAHNYFQPPSYSFSKIRNILNLILLELNDIEKIGTNNVNVLNIIQYIQSHVYEPITLRSVSKHVQLSKEYVSYIFKREIGKTISEYITEAKMNRALEMLKNNNLTLLDISKNLGYNNYCYFSKCFKETFNYSPKQMQIILKDNKEK